jgi:hypothetical protein
MGKTTRAFMPALAALLGVLALQSAAGATSPNGIGRMTVAPTIVTAGSTGNELSFTFTADSSPLKGQTIVDVPRGWTLPQSTSSALPGHVELRRGTCGRSTRIAAVKGRRITITTACGRRKSYELIYDQATAPELAADGYIFLARTRSAKGHKTKFRPLGKSKQPIVRVRGAAAASLFIGVTSVATTGVSFSVTVRGVDAYGNNAYPYAGKTVSLASTDPHATLPAPYAIQPTDAAQHIFPDVTLRTAGTQRITATDSGGLKAESPPISVSSASGARGYSAFAASVGSWAQRRS